MHWWWNQDICSPSPTQKKTQQLILEIKYLRRKNISISYKYSINSKTSIHIWFIRCKYFNPYLIETEKAPLGWTVGVPASHGPCSILVCLKQSRPGSVLPRPGCARKCQPEVCSWSQWYSSLPSTWSCVCLLAFGGVREDQEIKMSHFYFCF